MDVGAAAVCRRLIYDPLSFACVFTGFWELHSIRAAGGWKYVLVRIS